jgi:hypothetical protein
LGNKAGGAGPPSVFEGWDSAGLSRWGLFCCRRAVIVIPSFEIKTWMDAKAAFQGLGNAPIKRSSFRLPWFPPFPKSGKSGAPSVVVAQGSPDSLLFTYTFPRRVGHPPHPPKFSSGEECATHSAGPRSWHALGGEKTTKAKETRRTHAQPPPIQ